jgi:hypothetical protein
MNKMMLYGACIGKGNVQKGQVDSKLMQITTLLVPSSKLEIFPKNALNDNTKNDVRA